MKTIILEEFHGKAEYVVDRFYKEGVNAFQQSIPYGCNPYRDGSQRHDQWNYGHVNESEQPGHLK